MSIDGAVIAEGLRNHLAGVVYGNEYDLQDEISRLLTHYQATREAQLSDGKSRIDFLIDGNMLADYRARGIGIEVKIASSLSQVIRQLDRYAACPEILELILISTRANHLHVPLHVGARNIRVHLVSLIKNGL